MLSKCLNIDFEDITTQSVFTLAYDRLNRTIDEFKRSIFEKSSHQSMIKRTNELNSFVKELTSFVEDGPVCKPNLMDLALLELVLNSKQSSNEIEFYILELQSNYSKNYRVPMVNLTYF